MGDNVRNDLLSSLLILDVDVHLNPKKPMNFETSGRRSLPIILAVIVCVLVISVLTIFLTDRGRDLLGNGNESKSGATTDAGREGGSEDAAKVSGGRKAESDRERREALSAKLAEILAEPDYREQPSMLFDLMSEASLEEVKALLALSEENPDYSEGFKESVAAAAFERWYSLDPASGIRALDASSLGLNRKKTLAEVLLEDWANQSPEEVFAFLGKGELTGVPSDTVYGSLVRGSAKTGDRASVEQALQRITDPKLHSYAVRAAARTLQDIHADVYGEWIETLPPSQQASAIGESAWILAGKKEIDGALEGLKRLEEMSAENLTIARRKVVVEWTRNEPARAADWALSQNIQGEEREILFGNVLRIWLADDNNAAVEWVESQVGSGKFDEAFMNRLAQRL